MTGRELVGRLLPHVGVEPRPGAELELVEHLREDAERFALGLIEAQPAPEPTTGRPIWELVVEDMTARDQLGRRRYGVPLQTHNGRDALIDAYQEALDLCVYLRQAIEERDNGIQEEQVEAMPGASGVRRGDDTARPGYVRAVQTGEPETAARPDDGCEALADEVVAGLLTTEWRRFRRVSTEALNANLTGLSEHYGDVCDLLSELHVQTTGRRPTDGAT